MFGRPHPLRLLRRLLPLLGLLGLLGAGSRPLPARAQAWQRDPLLHPLLIHQVLQNAVGLLWVATDRGVFRYDGYELVPLRTLVRTTPYPVLGYVQALALDSQGILWIGTTRGLFRFDDTRADLRQIPLPGSGRTPISVNVLVVHPRSRALWVGYGARALACFGVGRTEGRAVPSPLQTPAAWLGPAADSAVWAVSLQHRVAYVTPTGGTRRPYRPTGALLPVAGTQPLQLVGTHALYQEQPDGTLRERARWLPGPDARNFIPGQRGRTWQWVVDGQRIQLDWGTRPDALPRLDVQAAPFEQAGTLHRQFTTFTDAAGLRWTTSSGQRGCYKERPAAVSIVPLDSRPLPTYSTRALVRLPDGRLLVGAYGATLVQPADSPTAPLRPYPLTEDGHPSDAILLAARVLPSGEVLFAEENHPFGVFDPRTGRIRRLAWADPARGFVGSLSVFADRRGNLWGGTTRGLYQLDLARRRASLYPPVAGTPLAELPVADVTANVTADATANVKENATPNRADTLWLATQGGVYRVAPTGQLTRYATTEPAARHLPTDDILTVLTAPDGDVWAGTRDAGLLRLRPGRGLRRQLSTETGFPSSSVATLLWGPDHALWCGTYAGLVRYEVDADRFTVLTTTDGLRDDELNRQSALADTTDGALYVGGVGGVHRVVPTRRPRREPPAPRLLLTAVTQHHSADDATRTRYLRGLTVLPLTLAPYDAFAELRFALTDYLSPEQARYRYRLLHSPDERWHPLGSAHVLTLQALPAGAYTLEVQATSGRGVRARNRLRIPVTVEAIWWRRPGVWLLAGVVLLGLFYSVHRRRVGRILREERLRNRIAADLHDEVGTLLTRISLQAEMIRQSQPAGSPALDRLLTNSRAAARTMRDIVWGIDAHADTVGSLLDRMRDHLDQTATPTGLNTQLLVTGLTDAAPLPPETRQQLYLIFKEAVTNTARHARAATQLTVSLTRRANALTLLVQDDGQPHASATRSGLGRRSMEQRAASINGYLTAGFAPGGGFRVEVRVPMG